MNGYFIREKGQVGNNFFPLYLNEQFIFPNLISFII